MAGWNEYAAPLIFKEGENEEAMLSRFIELSAKHPNYDHFQIAESVFKGAVDGSMRALQAAKVWIADLDVKERIDAAKRNGGVEPVEFTKADWEREVLALARDKYSTPQEKKAAVDAYTAYAKSQGWMIESQKIETDDKTRRFPNVIIAQANAA